MSSRYASVREPASPAAPAAAAPIDLTPVERLRGRVPSQLVERISVKVQAALWVGGAAAIFFKGGVYEVASDPARSNPFFIYLGLAALALQCVLALYSVVWVPRVHGSQWGVEVVAPGVIEAATLAAVTALLSFIVGLWPGFGLLTPLVVGFLAMGCIFVTHFIPAWLS
jgi:hypothetical protein